LPDGALKCYAYHLNLLIDFVESLWNRKGNVKLACSTQRMREVRTVYKVFVGISEGKRPRGRPRRKWKVNIRMDLMEIGWDGVD